MEQPALDHLSWLMRWYAAHCDGDWEHSYGVTIGTLDNPGWSLTIDLADTELAGKPFEVAAFNTGAPDGDANESWYHCKVEEGVFRAVGGASDLATLIGIFRAWAEAD